MDQVRETWKASVRRACEVLRIDRSLYTYRARRGDQAALKQRIKQICETRVRYGYRRIHVLLRREGWEVNPMKCSPDLDRPAGGFSGLGLMADGMRRSH